MATCSRGKGHPVRPPLSFWQRAEWARREGLITWGALAYLRTLVRLARARGDGQSFVLGERVIEDVTGIGRICCRRWRKQLVDAGLVAFDRRWANRRGWFWEAKTTLLFWGASGLKMSPEERTGLPGSKRARKSGLILSPPLNGKSHPSVTGNNRRAKARKAGSLHPPQPANDAAPGDLEPAMPSPEASRAETRPDAGRDGRPQPPDGQASSPPPPREDDPERCMTPQEFAAALRELVKTLSADTDDPLCP